MPPDRQTSMNQTVITLFVVLLTPVALLPAQFNDPQADRDTLPKVPAGFAVTMFAREPLVRQPCSMAFDARGRLFVGMGPQYRDPKPDTPGDSVVLVLDTDGDGVADNTKTFATGFNAVQGLAWHGRDLWVANAPDLTVVRDVDGDDQADEYVRVYTDLGNLEHGLHGLNWAPDGKLYMSKGNSKGLTQPGRIAPKPFRDLWGVTAPDGSPDFPEPQTFHKGDYQHAYHDPADDWGLDGGVLRCDDGGRNLEIVARGFRNPWDITPDSGFNWLGTDNDQTTGDRVFMPFSGAHFGWNHPWSAHWSDEPHPPTAPVSGPLFEGSGTGLIYYDAPQFPSAFRGVFFINDWLRKTTFVWRPKWDGALLRPAGGNWEPFVEGGRALFRPTDIEVGPDGALWVLGWSSGYGAEWKDGKLSNEGRVFRIAWNEASSAKWNTPQRAHPRFEWSVAELVADFAGPLPIWRTDAQEELVRRGLAVKSSLEAELRGGRLTETQETWTAWTLGRIAPGDPEIAEFFTQALASESAASLNMRIQAVRILAHRIREFGRVKALPEAVVAMLRSDEPRLRFAAVQAVLQARQRQLVPDVLTLLAKESDRTTFYAGWQAVRTLSLPAELRTLLADPRGGVRRAAVLALLETHDLKQEHVLSLAKDGDPGTSAVVQLWLEKVAAGGETALVRGRALRNAPQSPVVSTSIISPVRNIQARSQAKYQIVAGGLLPGAQVYTDRGYKLMQLPAALHGADFIQTANEDDGSHGDAWLTCEALLPTRVSVAVDVRMPQPPRWVREHFQRTDRRLVTDDFTAQLYSRDYSHGPIELGGNTDDGKAGGKGNYLVVLEPLPLAPPLQPTTIDKTIALLEKGDVTRGEVLFKHRGGAGCIKCHSLDETRNGFGPNLSSIGLRAATRHVVQSILEPNAIVTEGFNMQIIVTDDGKAQSGVLLEESGLSVTLGLTTGDRVTIRKSAIEERKSERISAMPSFAPLLTPQHVADLTAFLMTQRTPVTTTPQKSAPAAVTNGRFEVEEKPDRLVISHSGQPVAEFVFRDEKILRPYFANIRAPGGAPLTRNHPPIAGLDAVDHDTMHPGLWLGFGDISGSDFWRNKGRIEHVRFSAVPAVVDDRLTFTSEARLFTPDDKLLCLLTNRIMLTPRPTGWLLVWDATFRSDDGEFTFGDEEEMGFGARVATPLTEKNGGLIVNSHGQKTAATTWGQLATWCDYSRVTGDQRGGITLMAAPSNFRQSWWHNRDYGVFVANPFGRAAMKQGERSSITVKRGESFRITFGALLHDATEQNPAAAYTDFVKQANP